MTRLKITDKKPKSTLKTPPKNAGFWQQLWYRFSYWGVQTKFWKKFGISILVLVILLTSFSYGVAQWYINSQKDKQTVIGTTFIADYARHFDLDPQETLRASFEEIGFKRVRLVSYWEIHEHDRGKYNFDELDWQFEMAEEYGAEVSLAIGLRQPRWPECHMPDWAQKLDKSEWKAELYKYIETVVDRYKNHPSLVSYQLENEYFLSVFGLCTDFERDRLVEEYDLVKEIDPTTTLIVNRSNNATPSWPIGEPRADKVGAAIYKRVWDKTITQRYFEYPVPAWFYGFLAGMTELTTGRQTFIHELQTEPWVDERLGGIMEVSTEEQYKTMNPERFASRLEYAKATGMKEIDLWGTEWWYWLKVHRDDPGMWNAAIEEMQKVEAENNQ